MAERCVDCGRDTGERWHDVHCVRYSGETTAVFVDDGCGQDSTGDDVREWYVTPGDDDGEPTGKREVCSSFAAAMAAAQAMAARYGDVEVVTV